MDNNVWVRNLLVRMRHARVHEVIQVLVHEQLQHIAGAKGWRTANGELAKDLRGVKGPRLQQFPCRLVHELHALCLKACCALIRVV